jgi:hypothetical protein
MDSKHYPGKRYLLVQADVAGGAYMHPMPFRGAWVRWEDYAALVAERDRLRDALKDAAMYLDHSPYEEQQDAFDRALAALEEGGDG